MALGISSLPGIASRQVYLPGNAAASLDSEFSDGSRAHDPVGRDSGIDRFLLGRNRRTTDLDRAADPPLQAGAVLWLDLWRPVQPSKGGKTNSSSDDRFAGESTRRFPRLEPLGVERDSGVLGSRRPGHWTGRILQPLPGTDPLSDESFVKSWGPLPDLWA